MNVASLELCKELYELSGWKVDDNSPHWAKSNYSGSWCVLPTKGYTAHEYADESGAGQYYDHLPAYSLGYLLRKLPEHISVEYQKRVDYDGEFSWNLIAQGDGFYWVEDGFIEDVTCELAIELFKQGILTNTPKAKEAL